jgi:glutathione S-transferase
MRLYDFLGSGNGYKVRLLLAQLGVRYEFVAVDILRKESRTPEFLSVNPNGKIPAITLDDGTHLWESGAILWYFAEGTPFLPGDRLGRAEVLKWMFFEQYSHEPNIAVARFWRHFLEMTDERRAGLERLMRGGYAALDVMERHLGDRPYLVGERYSVADIALYAYTHVAEEGGFDLGNYAAIRSWLARVAGQPGHVPIDFQP